MEQREVVIDGNVFIYLIYNMCAHVQMQTHLQLLISSRLVSLHHKWQLVPSLNQGSKDGNVIAPRC